MPYYLAILLISLVLNLVFGVVVFLSNPQRTPNRQFLVVALSKALYLVCLGSTFIVQDPNMANILIRCTTTAAFGVFYAFYLLHLSLGSEASLFEMVKRSKWWLLAYAVVVAICFTPGGFFIRGVIMTETVPLPDPAIGLGLYNVMLSSAGIVVIWSLVLGSRRSTGIQRTEAHYILVGLAACVLVSLSFGVITPFLTTKYTAVILIPISFVIMDVVISYGVAAHRILEIGEFLRKSVAYSLLTLYLVALYAFILWVGTLVKGVYPELPPWAAPLVAALAMAFSLAPAHGLMQRFANRLFITFKPFDIQDTMRNANRVLQSLMPVDELLEQFSNLIGQAIGADRVQVLLFDSQHAYRQQYPLVAGGLSLDAADDLVQELKYSQFALTTDALQRMRQTPQLKHARDRLSEFRAKVAVGVHCKGTLEGIILLGDRLSGRMYSRTDQEALHILGNQLGVAIQNAKLYSEVRQSKVYNDNLLQNLVSGVISIDPEGHIRTCNQEAERILCSEAGDLIGAHFDVLPGSLAKAIVRTLDEGRGVRDEELKLRDGRINELTIRLGSSVFYDAEEGLMGTLIVFHDVTAMHELEKQVRQNDRLASIGTVAAGMAHEIKNPLVAIKTFTQLLPERYDEEEFRDTFSELIGSEVTRIDSIVNRLLHFARPIAPIMTGVRAHEMLGSMKAFLTHEFRKRGVQLIAELRAESDLIQADPNKLEQAFLNLLLNALDATEAGGKVTMRTDTRQSDAGSALVIEVSDTGCGIEPDYLDRIFDPFFTRKSNGTGLGLSVTHRIIQEHNARMDVESRLGEGTTFRLEFELKLAEEEEAYEYAS